MVRDWATDDNNEGSLEPDLPLGVQGELLIKIHPKEFSGDEKQNEPICIKQVERKKILREPAEFSFCCLFIEENVLHSTMH